MKCKLLISAFLSAATLCLTPNVMTASASKVYSVISPLYDTESIAQCILHIDGSTAECTSYYESNDAEKIIGEQMLQKQNFLGFWGNVKDASWAKTVYSNSLSMSNTKTDLESGTYRLKTVFMQTDGNGKITQTTVYSSEKTVN